MMERRTMMSLMAVVAVVIISLAAIQVAYAFTSETSNQGNNYSAAQVRPVGYGRPSKLPVITCCLKCISDFF